MNYDRLIRMVFNTLLRRLVRSGVNKGIDLAAGKGRAGGKRPKGQGADPAGAPARDARALAKRARRAARITRRFGR